MPENADFFQKMLTSAKLWGLGAKGYVFWKYIFVCLHTKFQVFSEFLTSFKQGGERALFYIPLPIIKWTSKYPSRLSLKLGFLIYIYIFFNLTCFCTMLIRQTKKKSMLFWLPAICFSAPKLSVTFCLSQLLQHNSYTTILALTS